MGGCLVCGKDFRPNEWLHYCDECAKRYSSKSLIYQLGQTKICPVCKDTMIFYLGGELFVCQSCDFEEVV